MKTKLKTLKDFEMKFKPLFKEGESLISNNNINALIYPATPLTKDLAKELTENSIQATIFKDLRQEAIKRAKLYYAQMKMASTSEYQFWLGKYTEVVDFNNMTEKDLEAEKSQSPVGEVG